MIHDHRTRAMVEYVTNSKDIFTRVSMPGCNAKEQDAMLTQLAVPRRPISAGENAGKSAADQDYRLVPIWRGTE